MNKGEILFIIFSFKFSGFHRSSVVIIYPVVVPVYHPEVIIYMVIKAYLLVSTREPVLLKIRSF